MVSDRKAFDMSKVCKFCLEKSIKLALSIKLLCLIAIDQLPKRLMMVIKVKDAHVKFCLD